MLDISWSEMAIIALVALLVLGPKELPGALRTMTQLIGKMRSFARDFQSGIDDIVREAEIDEARQTMRDMERDLRREVMEEGPSIDPQKKAAPVVKDPGADIDPKLHDSDRPTAPAAKAE